MVILPVAGRKGGINASPGEPSGILQCPSEQVKSTGSLTGFNTWKGSHYGINRPMGRNTPISNTQWGNYDKIHKASSIALFGDKVPGEQELIWYNKVNFRHTAVSGNKDISSGCVPGSGWNVGYLDGHVGHLKRNETPCKLTESIYGTATHQYKFWGDHRGPGYGWWVN
jgi:prepilin-type processing-associated H-X9-DG protein